MTPLTLILNESGLPHRWATWQDVASYKSKNLVKWEMGKFDWTKYGGISRMTGLQSSVNISSIIAVKGHHFPLREVPPLTNSNRFGRDLNTCAYCGNEFKKRFLTNDHIIPKSLGGEHSWTNCVTACRKCNTNKGSKLLKNMSIDLLYVPYTPNRGEALILKNRNILADQMEFIRKMLPKHSRLL